MAVSIAEQRSDTMIVKRMESRMSDDDWITTQQAADESGYHLDYIRKLLQAGKLQGRKWGQAWQVSRQSLIDYLASASNQPDKRWGPKP